MAYKEKNIEKLYYSIGEVAKKFGVKTSLIRFWEREFPMLKPRKTSKGNRLFTTKDIDTLALIYHLVKERGYTLEGAKKKLKDNKQDVINNFEIIQSLQKIRQFLVDIKSGLDD